MKKLFTTADGELKWFALLLVFIVPTVVGISLLGPEIVTSFTERFWRSGIWQIVGPLAGIAVWIAATKYYAKKQDSVTGVMRSLAFGVILFWGGLFGPNVGFKHDREASIPDNQVYYFNGKVQNTTDVSKKNYYFKEFQLNSVDSEYVVTYGEEPGRNINWQSVLGDKPGDYAPLSKAPRANENWKRPVTKNAQKFKDGKRE